MTIFDLLKKDHDEIKDILDKIDADLRQDGNEVGALFERLRPAVLAHAKAEEEVFYSVLEDHDQTEEMAEQAEDEHQEVEEMLEQMREEEPGDGTWRMIFQQAALALRDHIKEEEGEMFRAAGAVLGEPDLDAMAEAFAKHRERALSGEQDAQQRRLA
jgi:hemerythrin superfamily protein